MNCVNLQKKDRLEVKEAGHWRPKPWTGEERRNWDTRMREEMKKFNEVSFPRFVTQEIKYNFE